MSHDHGHEELLTCEGCGHAFLLLRTAVVEGGGTAAHVCERCEGGV